MLNEEAVKHASSLGFELSMMEVIKTQCLPFDINSIDWNETDAIVFTNENAVSCFFDNEDSKNLLKGKVIISTAGKTAKVLTKKGFPPSITGKNAGEISEKIVNTGTIRSVLHICGNMVLDILKTRLEAEKIKYAALIVYQTIPIKNKKPDEKFDAILFFSPSGVESYLKYNDIENEFLCCIGDTTAKAFGNRNVIVSQQPTPESMFETLANYFDLRLTTYN